MANVTVQYYVTIHTYNDFNFLLQASRKYQRVMLVSEWDAAKHQVRLKQQPKIFADIEVSSFAAVSNHSDLNNEKSV